MSRTIEVEHQHYAVVVVGGGLAGVCAAVSAARQGHRSVLVQNRPVLGGNSSAEVGVPPHGADQAGSYRHVRETGIIDEIASANANFPNYLDSPSIWSVVLWRFCQQEPNLTVHLNAQAAEVEMDDTRIVSVLADQQTTEKRFRITGDIFIDCSGDGVLGYRAGAAFMTGREGKESYGEPMAQPIADDYRMGNSIYMRARDVGHPVPFETPDWVYVIETDEDLPNGGRSCPHKVEQLAKTRGGWWWIETGGRFDTITEAETIRDELYRYALGVWDHLKNRGDHGADNYVLESINTLPGKRDSRRFYGDYVMTQGDVEGGRIFDDAVAYGGWHIDVHQPDGIAGEVYWKGRLLSGIYTIPYRALYSRNIDNLLFAGRNISASHVAFASARVMLTCALIGQAVGNAAALCVEQSCSPRVVYERHLKALQQRLLRQDCYLPGLRVEDENDLAPQAMVTASSEHVLTAPPVDDYVPMDTDRAQMFVASETALSRVSLALENNTQNAIEVTMSLRAARRIDDFSGEEDLAAARAVVQPGRHDIPFIFDCQLPEADCPYWILLKKTEGLAWGYTKNEEPATQAAKLEDQYFTEPGTECLMHRMRGTYGFAVEPASRCFGPRQVQSGVARPERASNQWISEGGASQWLQFTWKQPVAISAVRLVFDNGLDRTLGTWCREGNAPFLVRDYQVVFFDGEKQVHALTVENNKLRVSRCDVENLAVTAVKIILARTWGGEPPRVFEVNVLPSA